MAMHGHSITQVQDPGPVGLGGTPRLAAIGAAAGAILWIASMALGEPQRAWQAFLLSYFFFLMLGLGGIVFSAIQYCASARWSIAVRRLAEGMGSFVPVGLVLFLVLMVFAWDGLYGESMAFYMTWPMVLARGLVFYALWLWLVHKLRGNSLAGDTTRDASLHQKNIKLSIIFLLVFAYTFSLHVIDLLMALHPRWFSTIFGVYCFCGLFISTLCVLTLVTHWMRRRSPAVREAIQRRHLYDLGTWIMAFSCFMCYIGFSQYMLIWYANLPEETFYFLIRTTNGWEHMTLLLPLLKWVIPFLVLMPQPFRASVPVQVGVCVAVLVGQVIDIFWMIYPAFSDTLVLPGVAELGSILALGGVFVILLDRAYSRHSVLAIGDPHLKSSVDGSYL